ncbi:hypothetical protein K449DRAFT_388424 [Hypoxylon sp. EC38]|nr:hypothetical protein K449DRAFT_388424 [Hypoxylon sp. EC38]
MRAQQDLAISENVGSNNNPQLNRRGQATWWTSWKEKKQEQDTRRDDENEAWMPELQDTQMGSRVDPFYLSQRHGELQGTTVGSHPHGPVELESQPLGGSGLGTKNQ